MRKKRRFFPRTDECAARFWTAPVLWRFSIWSGRRKSGRGLPQSKTLSRRRTHLPDSCSQSLHSDEKGLSMNRKVGRAVLSPPRTSQTCCLARGAVRTPRPTELGSWSQCISEKRKGAFHEPAQPLTPLWERVSGRL